MSAVSQQLQGFGIFIDIYTCSLFSREGSHCPQLCKHKALSEINRHIIARLGAAGAGAPRFLNAAGYSLHFLRQNPQRPINLQIVIDTRNRSRSNAPAARAPTHQPALNQVLLNAVERRP